METKTTEPSAPTQRLYRRRADRKIAGVAAGLGDYFGVDPTWVRLIFVLMTIGAGTGIVIYLVLWLVLPVSDEPSAAEHRGPRELASAFGSSWAGTVLIAIGALVIGTQLFSHRPGLFWGAALVVLGIFLFRDRDDVEHAPRAPAAASPATVAQPPDASVAPPIPPPARAPKIRRARSPLGALTIGATLIVVGLLWWADVGGVLEVRIGRYFAAALLVIGAGLLVGAKWGRARWLIILGVLLVPAVIATSVIAVPFEGGHGPARFAPASLGELGSEYRHATGTVELDLMELKGTVVERAVPVVLTNALGRIEVSIPAGLAVDLRARVGVGSFQVQRFSTRSQMLEPASSGTSVDERRRFGPRTGPAIVLDVQLSFGTVIVSELNLEET